MGQAFIMSQMCIDVSKSFGCTDVVVVVVVNNNNNQFLNGTFHHNRINALYNSGRRANNIPF